jgi:protein-tyrosine phosphatase
MTYSETTGPPYLIHGFNGAGLWMMPSPTFGGTIRKTLSSCADLNIQHIASLVEAREVQQLGLAELRTEAAPLKIHLHQFPITDRQPPSSIRDFAELVETFTQYLLNGMSVSVHCKSGIGRSGMLASSILGRFGYCLPGALEVIAEKRGIPAPNTASQMEWLQDNWVLLSGT